MQPEPENASKGISWTPATPGARSKGEARRRLLRGSISAPAVLTLFSGSALAAGSNTMCVSFAVNTTKALPDESTGPDIWVRVQVYAVKLGNSKESQWVRGLDLQSPAGLAAGRTPLTTFISSGSWMLVATPGTGSKYKDQAVGYILGSEPFEGTTTIYKPVAVAKYRAVRFDANGNFVGVVNDGRSAPGYAVPFNSCWASFIARVV